MSYGCTDSILHFPQRKSLPDRQRHKPHIQSPWSGLATAALAAGPGDCLKEARTPCKSASGEEPSMKMPTRNPFLDPQDSTVTIQVLELLNLIITRTQIILLWVPTRTTGWWNFAGTESQENKILPGSWHSWRYTAERKSKDALDKKPHEKQDVICSD